MQWTTAQVVEQRSAEQVAQQVAEQLSRQLLAQLSEVLDDARSRLERCLALGLAGTATVVPDQRPGPDAPNVFRREGEYWTLAYAGEVARLRDSRGLQHLGQLLARPNQPVHVLELVAQQPAGTVVARDGGLEVLDAQARAQYRRRLAQLDDDLLDAEQAGDDLRRERCLAEREWLVRELARALGLGGRARTTGSSAERARTAVTKALRSAVAAVGDHHRTLGEHLLHTVRTGTLCTYAADPAPRWSC